MDVLAVWQVYCTSNVDLWMMWSNRSRINSSVGHNCRSCGHYMAAEMVLPATISVLMEDADHC